MTSKLWTMLALLVAVFVCFILNKPRADVVALALIVLFPLTGLLSVTETLAGFGNPSMILMPLWLRPSLLLGWLQWVRRPPLWLTYYWCRGCFHCTPSNR